MSVSQGPLTGKVAWGHRLVAGTRARDCDVSRATGRVDCCTWQHANLHASVRRGRLAGERGGRDRGGQRRGGPDGLRRPDGPSLLSIGSCRRSSREHGQIDILVNNAGGDIGVGGTMSPTGGKPDPNDAVFIPLEDVRAVIDRNLLSCILACKAVAPAMMDRKRGWIVNFGSTGGLSGRAEGVIYAAAKAAVHEYTRCLAAQLRPFNIPVNCIAPGGTVTPRFLATRQARPRAARGSGHPGAVRPDRRRRRGRSRSWSPTPARSSAVR